MIVQNDEGLYALAMMFLYILKEDPEYAALSQLSYILDRENFDKFIDYFGGSTIKVPTREEVNSAFKSMIYYQSRYIDGKSHYKSMKDSGASYEDSYMVTHHAKQLAEMMDEVNVNDNTD